MVVNTAAQPPCTQAEYEHFKTIYDGFCYLIDHKNEQSNSIYAFKQTEVHENLVEFWPTIEAMCRWLKIPLTVTPQNIECIFTGFDLEFLAALYKSERYVGVPRKKIIPMEEYRLIQVTKGLFDTLIVRLNRIFRMPAKTGISPNLAPLQAEWQNIPLVDEPIVPQHKKTVNSTATKPMETLNKTDSDILQAMAANPEDCMLRVEIEIAAGYGRYAVTQSLKRLETIGLVCKPISAKRKGWTLTEKGRSKVVERPKS